MNQAQGIAGRGVAGGGRVTLLFVAVYVLISGGVMVHSMLRLDPDPVDPSTIRPRLTAGISPRVLSDAVAESRAPARQGPGALDGPRQSSELYHRGLAAYADGRLVDAAGLWSTAAGLDGSNIRARRALDRVRKELAAGRQGAAAIGALANLPSLSLR